jgi:Nucleotide-binding C-terminal domain
MEKARTELTTGRDVILSLLQGPLSASGGKRSLRPSASGTLSEFLGCAMRRLAHGQKLGALILCGVDIAVATCRALGADGLLLGGEVEAGVPWGSLVGGERPNLVVVTKAGGFGSSDVFRAAIRFLRRRTRQSSLTVPFSIPASFKDSANSSRGNDNQRLGTLESIATSAGRTAAGTWAPAGGGGGVTQEFWSATFGGTTNYRKTHPCSLMN